MRRKHPGREDARYLELRRAGKSYRDIALLCGVSYRTAWQGVQDARDRQRRAVQSQATTPAVREPTLVPMFPVTSFVPGSSCPHHGPIARGSSFVCMVCHQSGRDDHPALQRPTLVKLAVGTEADRAPNKSRRLAGGVGSPAAAPTRKGA